MIRVLLNDEEFTLQQGGTIDALLQQLERDDAGHIAIAVNDQVVRRSEWAGHRLNDNDRVLMIAPIQGG